MFTVDVNAVVHYDYNKNALQPFSTKYFLRDFYSINIVLILQQIATQWTAIER